MRKVIASTYSTLDGYIDNPHEWSLPYTDEKAMEYTLTMTMGADALLLGRETYEGMAQAWPQMSGNPFADHVNAVTKHVVASQPVDTDAWGPASLVAGGELLSRVADIKAQPGRDILIWGCGRLTDDLAAAGLLDEYRIWVCPVIKGGGTPLFRPERVTPVEHVDTLTFGSGLVVSTYRPTPATEASDGAGSL